MTKPNPKGVTDIDRYAGAEMRRRRRDAGMTQDALAQKLGLTFQQIQKYERAVNRISIGRAYAIANALNCTVPDLMPPITMFADRPTAPPPVDHKDVASAMQFFALGQKKLEQAMGATA